MRKGDRDRVRRSCIARRPCSRRAATFPASAAAAAAASAAAAAPAPAPAPVSASVSASASASAGVASITVASTAASLEPADAATSCRASQASLALSSFESARHAYSTPSLHVSAIEISSAPHAGAGLGAAAALPNRQGVVAEVLEIPRLGAGGAETVT